MPVGKHVFKAVIERAKQGGDAAYVSVPLDVEKVFGTRGILKILATFDGHPYRGVLANMGTGFHVIGIRKDIRLTIGKSIGDLIRVTIQQDLSERIVSIPKDLKALFKKNTKARTIFETLSFTNRKEYAQWIASAKKEETRSKRLSQIIPMLLSEKKNPHEK